MGPLTQNACVRGLIFISKYSEAVLMMLKFIHHIDILLGDIHLENILVSNSGITIIDFGHSHQCNNQGAKNKEYQLLYSLLGLACESDLEG